jgi:hypothetical protein
LSQLIANVV